jgi:hypothetical protein
VDDRVRLETAAPPVAERRIIKRLNYDRIFQRGNAIFIVPIERCKGELTLFTKDFLQENGFESCHTIGRFASKRNQLYLLNFKDPEGYEKFMVYKLHSHRFRLAKETEMLFQLRESQVWVPSLAKVVGNGILMEYVSGPTILEYLEWQEKTHFQSKEPQTEPAMQAIIQLVDWLKVFYQTTSVNTGKRVILGNINLRNFIIRDNLYGVDFEDWREGRPEEDIGRICAFALTYSPSYTPWKKVLVNKMFDMLVNSLELERMEVVCCFFEELARINKRRGLRLRAGWLDDVLLTL